METLRTAVVGAGHQGRFHAGKYAELPGSSLVAVVDCDPGRARALAEELGVEALTDHRELAGRVDAVSVAVPTSSHHAVAKDLLEADIHLLVEKPIAASADEAGELIALARERGLVLQVGHLERFNPAVLGVEKAIERPLFIECTRLAPFRNRGVDVDVVLDLMIHDIDLISHLVRRPIESMDATGAAVISGETDIANARIRFAGGCVANVTASRVTLKFERKLRIFQHDAYISMDLHQRSSSIYRRSDERGEDGLPGFVVDTQSYAEGDAVRTEIEAFLRSVSTGEPPVVTGEDGMRALETALHISGMVQASLRNGGASRGAVLPASGTGR